MYPHDKQHLGKVHYYPQRGFFGDFYPYEGDKDYLSPLVGVQVHLNDSKFYLISNTLVQNGNFSHKKKFQNHSLRNENDLPTRRIQPF